MHILAAPPPMPGFLNALAGPLGHYGYWLIFALVMLEDFGVPVPGETVIIAAAIFAGHQQLNVVAVGVIAFVAAVIGDNIGFAIGHFGGRALAVRWGRYVFLTEERLDKAAAFFDRHGGKIIVVARFIEGLRQANGIIAGISGMHWRRFVIFNVLGAALWVGTWVSLGYLAGNHIDAIYHYITAYSYYVLIAAVVLLAAYVVRRVLRRRARSAGEEDSAPVEAATEPGEAAGEPGEAAGEPGDAAGEPGEQGTEPGEQGTEPGESPAVDENPRVIGEGPRTQERSDAQSS
jgi:membrane protein DedA with SNARE-associated domain